jgi:hypothetical protein
MYRMNNKIASVGLSLLMVLGAFSILLGGVAGDNVGNDSFVNAEAITPGTITGTTATTADEQDYYKFDLAAGQRFTVNYTTSTGDDGRCTVAKKDQTTFRGSGWLPAGQFWEDMFTIGAADAGTYYIYIEGGDTTYSFKLTVTDQNDGGQTGDAPAEINSARAVTPGKIQGWVADLDESDFYSFVVPAGNKINATLTVGNEPTEMVRLSLYKPDKNSLMSTSWTNPGLTETLLHQASDTTGGTYYMEVTGDTQSYAIDLSLTPENDAGSGVDVPGLIDNAYQLPGNGTYTGYLRDDDQSDFYKFNVSAGETMSYTITAGTVEADTVRLTLYKPTKDSLQSTSWLNPGIGAADDYTTNNAGGGVYYFEVAGENAYTLTLSLVMQIDANVSGDAGDTLETARPLQLNVDYTGFLKDMDDSDYYSFTGTKEAKLIINLNLSLGTDTIKGTLYKPDKNSAKATSWMNPGVPTTIEYTPADTGTHYLLVNADNASYTFNITAAAVLNDTEKPVVAVTSPANGATVNATAINLTGTASDNTGVTKVEISLNGVTWLTATGTTSWTYFGLALVQGSNNVTARATDAGGNTNTTVVTVKYVPAGTGDTEKPVASILIPAAGSKTTKNRLPVISGTAMDNVGVTKVELKVSGVTVPNTFLAGAWVATNVSLKEGKNTIVVTATDAAGNPGTQTITVTYEKPKPSPGFEVLFLAAAIVAGLVLVARRRK